MIILSRKSLCSIVWTTYEWYNLFSLFTQYIWITKWFETLFAIICEYSHKVSVFDFDLFQ